MAEEFVRYFDVDGEKRTLAASNLKKSGRLVIGIAGTHTPDDADILFGANESDAAENQAMLEEAQAKGGYGELFFLVGKYYLESGVSAPILRGSGGASEIILAVREESNYVVRGGLIRDITVSSTKENKYGIYLDCESGCNVENVHFVGLYTGIDLYQSHEAEIKDCYFLDCNIGIKVGSSENVTIRDCTFLGCTECGINANGHDSIHINDCKFDSCVNQITNACTTIGATKLTEDKVKALNKIPNEIGDTVSYVLTKEFDRLPFNLSSGLYVVSILEDNNIESCSLFELNHAADECTCFLNLYPAVDEFDYGIVTLEYGMGDYYIFGEDRVRQWLVGKTIKFTRIL